MWRSFFSVCFVSLILLGSAFVPSASAQVRSESVNSQKNAPNDPNPSENAERTPAMQYFAAAILSTVVLFVVCAPSRKGYMQSGDKGD